MLCGWVAGVIAALLQIQADATSLATLCIVVIRSEAAQLKGEQPSAAHETDTGEVVNGDRKKRKQRNGGEEGEEGNSSGAVLMLPAEAQPLVSLVALAQDLLIRAQASDDSAADATRRAMEARASSSDVEQVKRRSKRLKSTDIASKTSSQHDPPGSDALQDEHTNCLADLHVSASSEAASELSALVDRQLSRVTKGDSADALELQTALLRAPAAAMAAQLPRLVRLIRLPNESGDAVLDVMVRACRAHALFLITGEEIARIVSDSGMAEHVRSRLESLLDASPSLMLLQTINALPGDPKFATHCHL